MSERRMPQGDDREALEELEEQVRKLRQGIDTADRQRVNATNFSWMAEQLLTDTSEAHIIITSRTARIYASRGCAPWWPDTGPVEDEMFKEIHAAVYPVIMDIFHKHERAAVERYNDTLRTITGQPAIATDRNLRGIQVREKSEKA